jgi:hypothetical protein
MLARARARVRSRASEHAHARMSAISSAPLTDRGHKVTSEARVPFQVHWFTGVAELSRDDTFNHVRDVAGANLVKRRFGRMGYRSAYQAVELPGLMVLCDPGEPDTMPSVCLVVPGESCEALGWQRLQALSAPFKPTRVDLAFDDFPFSPSEVKALILNGSVRTRAQRHTVKYHEDFAKTDEGSLEPSQTVSLGSRGSSAFFRCYNSRGFNRGELELKGERAVAAYELLQSPLDLAREMAISFMRGFVDFVDPDSDSNKSRQECLLRWMVWFRWVARSNFQLPPRPAQTLERVWTWFERQLSPILGVLLHDDSGRFLDSVDQAEQTRWTDRHRLLLGCASGGFA